MAFCERRQKLAVFNSNALRNEVYEFFSAIDLAISLAAEVVIETVRRRRRSGKKFVQESLLCDYQPAHVEL
jgi:hypothetical protein